jgi:hypothetical protein
MKDSTKKLLVAQGYDEQEVNNNKKIIPLAKWTPIACALLGAVGVAMQSSSYLIFLGLLTFIGAFTSRSLYDYLYKYFVSYIVNIGDMPKHGIPRRIGCGIGACMYIISGIGFYWGSNLLAYVPSIFMIIFALIAGIFNWCFVSTFYGMIVGKKQECCG